jgi:uncharacterized membrane protein YheB (UPF0754 family)
MDGETFSEHDYGLVITTSSKTVELEQMIKQNAQAFIQNGGTMSTIMDIYFSPSLSDMRRRLEDAEEQMHQRQQNLQKQQMNLRKQLTKLLQLCKKEYFKCKKLKTYDDATKRLRVS